MSLFRAREWWSSKLGPNEIFSDGALAVLNPQAGSDGALLLVGSLQGVLRILKPTQSSNNLESSLLLETQFKAPIILQLEVGALLEACTPSIAILHPHKVSMCSVQTCPQSEISELVCHDFDQVVPRFSAFSMCLGAFGGVRQDRILVQSIGGRTIVFDRNWYSVIS